MELRLAERRGGTATEEPTATDLAAASAASALDEVTARAFAGDELVALQTSMLVDELPNVLARNSSSRTQRKATDAARIESLARAAARADAACLAAGAHAAMLRNWRELVGMLMQRRHVARPATPADDHGALSPTWLSNVSEKVSLESLMEARIRVLAKEHAAWAVECASTSQARQHADTLNAAAELLTQQALALQSGPGLAWQLVDQLMQSRSWRDRLKERVNCLQEDAARCTTAHVATCDLTRPDATHERMAVRETRIMALLASLDDGSQFRRSDAGEGWQLLRKLTSHLCGRLEAIAALPGASSALGSSASRTTITQAVAALKQRDNDLKQFGQVTPPRVVDTSADTLPSNLTDLAKQVMSEASPFGDSSALVTAEKQARAASVMLDSDCVPLVLELIYTIQLHTRRTHPSRSCSHQC